MLLSKRSERSRSGELHISRLFELLSQKGKSVTMHIEPNSEINDNESRPRRYIEYKSYRIGYSATNESYEYWNWKDAKSHLHSCQKFPILEQFPDPVLTFPKRFFRRCIIYVVPLQVRDVQTTSTRRICPETGLKITMINILTVCHGMAVPI